MRKRKKRATKEVRRQGFTLVDKHEIQFLLNFSMCLYDMCGCVPVPCFFFFFLVVLARIHMFFNKKKLTPHFTRFKLLLFHVLG